MIDLVVEMRVTENRARACRLEAVSRLHARRAAEEAARRREDAGGFFVLTPLQETTAELAPVLAVAGSWVATDLDLAQDMARRFPRTWTQCLSGRLDLGRACLLRDQLVALTCDEDRAAYAAAVEEFLDDQVDAEAAIHPVERRKLQRAARRRCRRFPQRTRRSRSPRPTNAAGSACAPTTTGSPRCRAPQRCTTGWPRATGSP